MKTIIYILLFATVWCSCTNKAKKEEERILREFDSINKSLKKPLSSDSSETAGAFRRLLEPYERTQDIVAGKSSVLYDSLEKKFGATGLYGKIRQMAYKVQDFYGYLADLKWRFYKACGDSTGGDIPPGKEGDLSLTNKFFLGKGPAQDLVAKFKEARDAFLANTKDSLIIGEANKLGQAPAVRSARDKDFMHVFFYNTPPVAAITILNKFELDIRNIEHRILQDYLEQ